MVSIYLQLAQLPVVMLMPSSFVGSYPDSFPPYFSVEQSSLPQSCKKLHENGCRKSGLYFVQPGITVFCDMNLLGGGWTAILRRLNKSQEFLSKTYQDFKYGFGDFSGNFWLGLDVLHDLTSAHQHELYIGMEDSDGNLPFARYNEFSVGNKKSGYQLSLSTYNAKASDWTSAGDSLARHHNGQKFSALGMEGGSNCGSRYGGWWYKSCNVEAVSSCNYMKWFTWSQNKELRSFIMYIREL